MRKKRQKVCQIEEEEEKTNRKNNKKKEIKEQNVSQRK